MRTHRSLSATEQVTILLTTALVLGSIFLASPPLANAYLMMIRQGSESEEIPNGGDRHGQAVATGDFNGDGFDDVAMAAPFENEGVGPHEHGAVVVNYGSERGIRELGSDFLTVGAVTDDQVRYGYALASGNFNNDAYDDLAVGLPDIDGNLGTVESSGAVWIHLGGPTGLQPTADFIIDQTWAGDFLEVGDRFGAAVTTGDFNLDTFDDLAVGSPGEDAGSGAVFVFDDDAGGISIGGGGLRLEPVLLGTTPQADGAFGSALAAGDMFSGAEEDLAIGAHLRDVAGTLDAGQVYLVPGSATGLSIAGAFHVDQDELPTSVIEGSEFGFSLAVGHFFDLAGVPNQLAIGVPGNPVNLQDDVGIVYVLQDFSPPFFAGATVRVEQNDAVNGENEENDRFGHAVGAGDFDEDGFDELAVGVPNEKVEDQPQGSMFSIPNAGQVFMWRGGDAIFDANDASVYHARTLNDTIESSANIGWALAFGAFDSTGRANLAIGAPGKDFRNYRMGGTDPEAGSVYILAPWRQPTARPHRSSVALDCDGEVIFAQRPFQAVTPASVTKAMTALLATEAIQASEMDSNAVVVIPTWVANNVSGSQAGFAAGEEVRFVDLIKLAIAISAGDACYAIGDTLTGGGTTWNGLDNTIPLFNNRMNIRRMELGMNRSSFNNPSGRPLVDHFSAALDWALFGHQAMQNELFRYYVGRRVWAIQNYTPTNNGWLQNNQDNFHAETVGIKPGGNGLSLKTGLWSAFDQDLGYYTAAAFGIPSTSYGAPVSDSDEGTGRELLDLAIALCAPDLFEFPQVPPPMEPPPGPFGTVPDIPTGPLSAETCPPIALDTDLTGDALIEVYPQDVPSPPANFSLEVHRSSELILGPGESIKISFSPLESHQGFRLYNVLGTQAQLSITTTEPGGSTNVTLDPDSIHVVPAHSPITAVYVLTIVNTSSVVGARLQLDELGYEVDGSVGPTGPFTTTLSRDPKQFEEVVRASVKGQDASSGNLVFLVMHTASANVGIEPVPVVTTAGLQLYPARPNPFRQSTTVSFDLSTTGPVWASVHDLSGRRIRMLSDGLRFAAGRQQVTWDGRDDYGRPAPAGVYFQRIRTADTEGTVRFIRLR